MCSQCAEHGELRAAGGGRRKLWLIPREYHCSIVGTCLSPDDIAWLSRRLDLRRDPDARDYDVHRYFVQQAGLHDVAAKLMQKRLDEKFSGELRRFQRETTEAGWSALWTAAVNGGNVAAAYWALLTHPCVSDSLKIRAFGDVHMLSHLMGGENRQQIRENQDLQRRVVELEDRVARVERSAAERVAERDERIKALEAQLQAARTAALATARPSHPDAGRLQREAVTLRRRLTVERVRARRAEAEAERLNRLLDGSAERLVAAAPAAAPATPEDAEAPAVTRDLNGRSILYVGGRLKLLPHIRAAVEARNGSLLHHDGGMEQAARCLEGLVERADVVVCPIDCISHDACLRVKGLCRRLQKPFLPLRSHGTSSFARMLNSLEPAN